MKTCPNVRSKESGAGLLVGGLMFSYATGSTVVSTSFGEGSIETSGLGLGLAATWYDNRRFYVDEQMTLASYTSDLTSDDGSLGTLAEGNSGTGLAVSIEAGQKFDLGTGMTVIPQAQLRLSSVGFEDFASEAHGEQVTFDDAASQQLRLGLEFAGRGPEARRLYGIANLFHEFDAGSEVSVAGAPLTTESEPWAVVGVGIGGNYGTRAMPHPLTSGSVEAIIEPDSQTDRTDDTWVIDNSAHGYAEALGLIWLERMDSCQSEVFDWIAPAFWNSGFASVALCSLIAINPHKSQRIFAEAFHDNPGCARVLTSCGFDYLGDAEFFLVPRNATVATWAYTLKVEE